MPASYLRLFASGELERRARESVARLEDCRLCPRSCGVDRLAEEEGFCRTGRLSRVASYDLHFGEEAPLVGRSGSGTVFFMQCNLACEFCQNWDISHGHECGVRGAEVDAKGLARIMLDLQNRGAVNINLVTPSHVVPQILEALILAAEGGLRLPLVYNSGGYDLPETLELLRDVVDIYLPDVKIWDPDLAGAWLEARDYPERARAAVATMHRQVGNLRIDEKKVARQGVLVRHLVLPEDAAGTGEWMKFLADLSHDMYVNVMGQYRPCGRAGSYPALSRAVWPEEVEAARVMARQAGLSRLDDRESDLVERLFRRLVEP
ncbi:MAG: radical SAM protein [Deltaproteobacteria bacterium]|nr:radical SAM protein [Deltaproteobacteria bacterium]